MIRVEHVAKKFGNKSVLEDVSFEVQKGETVAIIGPSGCGKSTLLRLIIGFFPADRGQIFISEKETSNLPNSDWAELRSRIGMVFQSSALFSSLSVRENVAFGLRQREGFTEEAIRKIVDEKLDLVGLRGSADLMPEELSGGMQKRVSLARALAMNPEIMLYDEPTTGLDPIMSVAIENLIRELDQKLHMTAIVVTHQLSTVYRVSDRVLMLHQGKILLAGSPEETRNSKDPVVREFVTGGVERSSGK